jgi:hypothetical protein
MRALHRGDTQGLEKARHGKLEEKTAGAPPAAGLSDITIGSFASETIKQSTLAQPAQKDRPVTNTGGRA